MGKTITIAGYILWLAFFNRVFCIAILANNATKAREILGRIKLMYEEIPDWLKPGVVEWNKGSIEFSNGSKIFAGPTTTSSLRGYSINLLYLDEFGFVDNDVEFYTSAYPVISSGKTTRIIITSTPNGMNLFYKLWVDALNKRNAYNPKIFTWNAHPLRDENWKIETLKNMTKNQFDQEFECIFFGSSSTLIGGNKLEQLTSEFAKPETSNDYANVYENPIAGNTYVTLSDVGEGVGKDYSTIQVINISEMPYKQVYVYRRNDIDPWSFANVVHSVCQKYNNAYLLVENNSIGKIVADTIYYDLDYEHMLSSSPDKKGNEVLHEFSLRDIGIRMTGKTKRMGCAALKVLIEEDTLSIVDWDTIQELSTFVKRGNSYRASRGKHDDLAMPLVAFGWLSSQPLFEDMGQMNVSEIVKQKRKKEEEDAMLGVFYSDGTEAFI